MVKTVFKKTVIISLLGHITLFGIFSFSFGNRLENRIYPEISSLGAILGNYDLIPINNFKSIIPYEASQQGNNILPLPQGEKVCGERCFADYYLKPAVDLRMENEKQLFIPKFPEVSFPRKKKESVVMFYPSMPYHFNLYFKDRQVVHIELEYNLVSRDKRDSIIIKRKISSGNLDVDLLCTRYIDQYLSIQQDRLIPNQRQVVKIDLELKK